MHLTRWCRFKGNPLAIVKVGDSRLSHQQKQQIAREFNFSETVFLHHADHGENPRVEIFTPVNEMEFAGHPVIGTGHFLFRELLASSDSGLGQGGLTLETKAGPVAIYYNPVDRVVSAEIPHNVHIHSRETPITDIISVQASLDSSSDLHGTRRTSPTVSIVKGVTYILMDLTERPDIFAKLVPGECPKVDLDEGWSPSFVGTMYYQIIGCRAEQETTVWDLRVRMIAINLEDPACGSGSCSLGAYLALRKGQQNRKHRFYIDQGSEMGRDSRIIVDINLNEEGSTVSSIKLAGHAAFVAQGKIFVD